ncbi:MAG TPA: YtxH domain-containing protein [Virgibacillus sp.]|nr:YtxH domain-containing protein [Virgibacillus sp.]
MGKRKLIIGVIVGAVAGGLTTLFDSDTRAYTKAKVSQVKTKSSDLMKNPSQTVGDIRNTFDQINENVSGTLQKAINTLDDIEESLESVTGETDRIEN